MVLYVGETITVKVTATNPLRDGQAISDATCVVELYAVDTDPKTNPDARTVTTTHAATYDDLAQAYVAQIPTAGLAAGKHPYRAVLSGAYDSWEFGTFTLKA